MRWSKQNVSLPGMSRDFAVPYQTRGGGRTNWVYSVRQKRRKIYYCSYHCFGRCKDDRRKGRSMTGKTHSATGFFAGLVISHYTGCPGAMTLAMATGSVLGGLLPDIDNVHSQIGSRLPVVELIVHGCQRGIRLLSGILPRKLRENVRSMTGHRGLLHSLLVPAAMLLALPVIGNTNGIEKTFLIGMIAGNLSHLILDMLSGGVPLLIPFSVARIRVCNFRTGGIMDKLWRLVMYFGIGYLGLSELYQIVSKYIRI